MKRRADLIQGFDNLRERRARGVATWADERRQGVKLQNVEAKIFALRQLSMNFESR